MSKKLKEYYAGINWLYENKPYMANYVSSLGAPKTAKGEVINTAAVVLTHKGEVELHINSSFLKTLTDGEKATVLAHEFNHVLLNHLDEQRNNKDWPNKKVLELAHEVVINDYLELIGFEMPKDRICGENFDDYFAYDTTDEAYHKILEKLDEDPEPQENDNSDEGNNNENNDGSSSDTSEGSEGQDSESGSCSGALAQDKNGNYRKLTDEELEELSKTLKESVIKVIKSNDKPDDNELPTTQQLESGDQEIADALHNDTGSFAKGAGHDGSEIEKILSDKKLNMNWVKILKMVNPEVGADGNMRARGATNWARRRRTTYGIPNVILPTTGLAIREGISTGTKPEVLLALDFSGSVPRSMTEVMTALAKSIPEDKISVTCVTFSTYTVPFNHKADKNMVASGGTNFDCVHEVALEMQKSNRGRYPHVICMTDGEAGFNNGEPNKKDLDHRWIWVDITTNDDSQAFVNNSYYSSMVANQKNKVAIPYDLSNVRY